MECGRRRKSNYRRNCGQHPSSCAPTLCGDNASCCRKSGGFLSSFCSLLILSALMALIYLMLEYHCTTCKSKCEMSCITKSIEDITNNLSHLKDGYYNLEKQISKFSHELPRLHGQLEVLESLANTLENSDFGWNPKNQLSLPNVDVYLTKTGCDGKNISRLVKSVAYTDDCIGVGCPSESKSQPLVPFDECRNGVCPSGPKVIRSNVPKPTKYRNAPKATCPNTPKALCPNGQCPA